eukprot:scaffold593_cov382-Prasinococcus_capsulatus_cf.AAC.30
MSSPPPRREWGAGGRLGQVSAYQASATCPLRSRRSIPTTAQHAASGRQCAPVSQAHFPSRCPRHRRRGVPLLGRQALLARRRTYLRRPPCRRPCRDPAPSPATRRSRSGSDRQQPPQQHGQPGRGQGPQRAPHLGPEDERAREAHVASSGETHAVLQARRGKRASRRWARRRRPAAWARARPRSPGMAIKYAPHTSRSSPVAVRASLRRAEAISFLCHDTRGGRASNCARGSAGDPSSLVVARDSVRSRRPASIQVGRRPRASAPSYAR